MATRTSFPWWRDWRTARSSDGRRRVLLSWTWPTILGVHARVGCWRRTRRRWDRGEGGGIEGGNGRKCCDNHHHLAPPVPFGQVASQLFPSFFVSPSASPSLSLPSLLYPSVLLFLSAMARREQQNNQNHKSVWFSPDSPLRKFKSWKKKHLVYTGISQAGSLLSVLTCKRYK